MAGLEEVRRVYETYLGRMEELQQTLDRLNAKIERYETVLIPIEKQLGGGPS